MNEYAQKIRRQLHEHPETGFDLPNTIALVKSHLDEIGIPYTEKYGKSSIVATMNEGKGNFTIGIRADMDALPLTEESDVPYKSKEEGKMHACGHDAHTAILLATIKELYKEKDNIACCVKFLFQPAEEASGGAKMMVENGVMEDIDCVIALHVNNKFETGKALIVPFEQNANSDGFYLDFYGESAHVAQQETGVDAIMMAVKAYTDIEFMIAKEINATHPCIFNVGMIRAGETNNILADYCRMFCTLRTYYNDDEKKCLEKIKTIAKAVAMESGGRAEYIPVKSYPIVYNNELVTKKFALAAEKVLGKDGIIDKADRSPIGEDFSYFSKAKPGCFIHLGTGNIELGITAGLHHTNFDIDENALDIGVKLFKQFVYDNMFGL